MQNPSSLHAGARLAVTALAQPKRGVSQTAAINEIICSIERRLRMPRSVLVPPVSPSWPKPLSLQALVLAIWHATAPASLRPGPETTPPGGGLQVTGASQRQRAFELER
eukprot:CAMPEP_0114512320 /NCGR_PEP_ID=MMETSP0109-20121206/14910_1 /TAXON_ID=29199 /ORGANISM="Chlorarachnion reptans, Strain CCCM449" /LENGTH=108 /DNA_ID=CAMNT_0001691991 /DNA_START=480 /DNA_END=803 /DNA_ORIENTATION=-